MTRVHPIRLAAMALGMALSVSMASTVWASVPTEMTVQGKLTDPGGTPQTGTFTFTFRIYNAPVGGTDVWTAGVGESQSLTTDANGLWTARLGMTTALTDAVFNGTERWLEITVDDGPGGNPTETLARTKLNTNPYTYRASTVDGASGGTITGHVTVSGGNIELDLSTSTDGNILKAGTPFIHNRGTNNTFVGLNAGNLTMTGIENTANGADALKSNTTGGENTASGHEALRDNTTGFANTASGSGALNRNTTGESNTANGTNALFFNADGNNNTASGTSALFSNTSGSNNTAGGTGALRNNTTGFYNTGSGSGALYNNTDGHSNTASGGNALYANTTGYNNTASGASALRNSATGFYNTASGASALYFNTTGNNNTASGVDALVNNTTGSENTANGVRALFFNITGGGNTACGYEALQGNTFVGTSGSFNTASGGSALSNNTTGVNNTASGALALYSNITGNSNTAIGYAADVSAGGLTNATSIGANAIVDASNKIRLGDATVTVIEGQVAYTFTSDKNQKENFQPVDGEDVLDKLQRLDLSSWNYKGQDPQQFRHYGPVAQEFFAAFGHDGMGTSGTPTTINSGDEAGILMIAVQAQQRQIEDLKAKVVELQRLLSELQK